MPSEFFETLFGEFISESLGSVIRNPLSNFLWFPFHVVGTLLIWMIDDKKRKFEAAWRVPTAKYYGLIVVAAILFTWFFFAFT